MSNDKKFVIWSNEHCSWWRADSCGYTKALENAGRYPHDEALNICINANYYLPETAQRNEFMLLAPEFTECHALPAKAGSLSISSPAFKAGSLE